MTGSPQHLDVPAIAGGQPVRSKDRFLIFGQPNIGEAEIDAVVDCLRRRWIGSGPKVRELERDFAEYKGGGYTVATSSGTAALHLAMLGLGIGPGDEVITTSMTFCSTVNAIIHAGATPVLVDCDHLTQNIAPELVEQRITSRTKAILVVHLYGRCCQMDDILRIAGDHGLLVIEDCAHAIEATCHGSAAGLIGDVGCFSFYATKNMTTAEGGMLLTANADLADRIRTLALHGMDRAAWHRYQDDGYKHYSVVTPGFKYNLTDLQAAIGIEQLKRLEGSFERRTEIWQSYHRELADLPCLLPSPPDPDCRHALHLYTPLLHLQQLQASRDDVLNALTAEGIGVGVHYLPVHRHPYYRSRFGWDDEMFPNANDIGDRTLSLPLCAHMTGEDVSDVCRAFRRVLRYYA